MNNDDGCLAQIGCLAVVGVIAFFLCITGLIGDALDVPASGRFLVLIGIVIVLVGLPLTIYGIYSNHKEKIYEEQEENVKKIEKTYNLAYRKFITAQHIRIGDKTKKASLEDLKKISTRPNSVWEKEERQLRREKEEREKREKELKEKAEQIEANYSDGYESWEKTQKYKYLYFIPSQAVVESERRIASLDKHIKSENWEKRQSSFADKCYEISKEVLSSYGRYYYYILFNKYDVNGNAINGEYEVWQFFCDSMCNEDLNYTYYKNKKENAAWVSQLKSMTLHYNPPVYNRVAKFIKEVAFSYNKEQQGTTTVLFNYDKDWNKDSLNYHYNPLRTILDSDEYKNIVSYCESSDIENKQIPVNRAIIIFDIYTENDELKKLCEKIITHNNASQPVIAYISLLKAYDRAEMQELIDDERKRQDKIREEKEKEENAKKSLVEDVSSWQIMYGGLHYHYFVNYYPTTCDFDATQDEWDDRWLVWNFKNTPGKTSAAEHESALGKVIPLLHNFLTETFGKESLKYLTLVCIPASTRENNIRRYKDFSDRLCKETGMINAYDHVTITKDAVARHLGGTGENEVELDKDFFKDKYVLIFDDVITRGDSMRKYQRKLTGVGAKVVAGLSIGKTKHHRDE